MDYDNLKECRNCGILKAYVNDRGFCSHCQQVEDYVPHIPEERCPHCDMQVLPFFEGELMVCFWCGEFLAF